MKLLFSIGLALTPLSASAQDISGSGRAMDGDSLDMAGIVVRLHGVDAPELNQICAREGQSWACGKEASARLAQLVNGAELRCEQHDVDNYDRIVASCTARQVDLGQAMVEAGLAVALPQFSDRYVGAEARAKAMKLGIWNSDFQQPADYRSANPRVHRPKRPVSTARQPIASPSPPGVYYRNCSAARAAGAAPLYRGQPGYRPEMDGDGDGVACEPFRRR
ncbi:MAG: thermonuclease family protein [Sphingopyxis sp.]|uniref:thermonuclease family protein n=1 Tax=Sphingopyxis sp. TaxID=1908224 RepID=UPI001A38C7FE|nr:thermonuclease family protein [Sphingopyxis sp.]MBL9065711.1 thermonuclease family protein [Sphingopyxis sp.]